VTKYLTAIASGRADDEIVRFLAARSHADLPATVTAGRRPLSAIWWTEFNSKLSTAITRATATPVPALAALQ
jgi:hypothetical protein